MYSNESIYILNYLKTRDIFVEYGKLSYLNNSELSYQYKIKEEDSSCSPILLTNNQKLFGIYNNKKYNKRNILFYSIYEFSKTKNNLLFIDKYGDSYNNYIIAEFDIKEDNKNIRIINSYEQVNKEHKLYKSEKEYENELQIKDNCEIRINEELIPFSYYYKFNKRGKYIIKYSFLLNITKTNYMFRECSSLTNINLCNFITNNLINMSSMFFGCSSLTNINLSNFNTNNVTNTSSMFYGCSSLTKINLSNFNTNNVTIMSDMFNGCKSLTNIDLSNFNTNNAIKMDYMFNDCESLTNINLSNFNTNNVTNMSYMFNGCTSLISLDLSNFITNNVKYMFNMFKGCKKLNKKNIITQDENILKEFMNL